MSIGFAVQNSTASAAEMRWSLARGGDSASQPPRPRGGGAFEQLDLEALRLEALVQRQRQRAAGAEVIDAEAGRHPECGQPRRRFQS